MPTALIVDDEPAANALLAQVVRMRRYESISALTGRDALEYLAVRRPDVVFLDLMLPDTNGYDVCRAIKTGRETSLIPVVIVSARLAAENRTRSYQLGAQAYVAKPYTPDQIFAALDSAAAFSRQIENNGNQGELRLGDPEDHFYLGLSRLRSLLLARTPLDEAGVAQIIAAVGAIGQDARAWGRQHQLAQVATARYQLQADGFHLIIRDEAGWFAGGDLSEASAGFDPDLHTVFDEVRSTASGTETVLVKAYPAGAASSP